MSGVTGNSGDQPEARAPVTQQDSSNTNDTHDEVAIVTGAASGIGHGTALAFAALNYRLVLIDKNADRLAETGALCLQKSPKRHRPLELSLDISTGEQVAKEAIERTLTNFGRLDVLINNAGITALTKFDDPDCVNLYHKIIATNMHSVVYLCLAAFEPLKRSRGSIVNVSSVLDDKPAKYKFAYCMSKAAITMLTKCLANDFGPHVRVNSVSPGPVASSILDDMGINLQERESSARSSTLVGRMGRPEEVAKMIIHLASKEKAAFITGSRVLVDGGYTICPSGRDSNLKQNNAGIKLRGASFLMHQVYDDETTFKLVAAASNVSGLPVETCLEEFGKHFLVYCQKNGYDQILRVLGSNLHDFLTNLDNLHDHLASIYPGMRAPSFRVTKQLESSVATVAAAWQQQQRETSPSSEPNKTDEQQEQTSKVGRPEQQGSMYLHYYSERKGLSPIVKGLVMAVAKEFFSTDIVVTECAQTKDDHVVFKIDRRSQAQISLDADTSEAVELAAEAERKRRQDDANDERQATKHKAAMLSAAYSDLLSMSPADSLIDSEIMIRTFPFHVIFDRQLKLVQVGTSLLRASSLFWKRTQSDMVKLTDLFSIVRPKIEFTFDAIGDHTNQVFVVRTRRHVLNADYLRSSTSLREQQQQQQQQQQQEPSKKSAECSGASQQAPGIHSATSNSARAQCPFDKAALERRAARQQQHQQLNNNNNNETAPTAVSLHDDPANELVTHLSLRLKGQMIILAGSSSEDACCLFLCSPRVDHLDQLQECGVNMSDFALHDRARELMLMSHTHKEDRETVKKLDQASNDLKKMDTKLRQENKRTNEVLHNIFPAKIAALLSHGHKVESESHELVSCLYSDIIGFTKMCGSENVRPIDIVRLLNTLYLQFDNLTNIHGVYKVETIGDAYVVVGGLPEPVEDHADRCVRMGLDMVKVIATVRSPADNQPIQMRIGIHSGPVMAGIVGIRVPRYSLFGNTTTLANQLETHGVGGKIHISDFTLKNLVKRDRFVIEPNQNQISSIPFKTYFVSNFIGDEIETLKHEKILEEQLIRDFELMGNEVELVDDSNRSANIASSSAMIHANKSHQDTRIQSLKRPTTTTTTDRDIKGHERSTTSVNLSRERDKKATKNQPRVYMDVEGTAESSGCSSAEMASQQRRQQQQQQQTEQRKRHKESAAQKTNNNMSSARRLNDEHDMAMLAAEQLSSRIVADALDQLAVRYGSAGAGQTTTIAHSNEPTMTTTMAADKQESAEDALERLLAMLTDCRLNIGLRPVNSSDGLGAASSGCLLGGGDSRHFVAETCPLCDGLGSLQIGNAELSSFAAGRSDSGACSQPSDVHAKLLTAAVVSEILARRCGVPSNVNERLNRLVERLTFSLSFCADANEPSAPLAAGGPNSSSSSSNNNNNDNNNNNNNDNNYSKAIRDDWPLTPAWSKSGACNEKETVGGAAGTGETTTRKRLSPSGPPEPNSAETRTQRDRQQNNGRDLEQLLSDLCDERRKLEKQVERLSRLTTSAAAPLRQAIAQDGRVAREFRPQQPPNSSSVTMARQQTTTNEENGNGDQDEDEDDEFDELNDADIHSAPSFRHDQRGPKDGATSGTHSARILSSNIQRMKRMDTLKRHKLIRSELSAREQQARKTPSGQLAESGSIRSVHSLAREVPTAMPDTQPAHSEKPVVIQHQAQHNQPETMASSFAMLKRDDKSEPSTVAPSQRRTSDMRAHQKPVHIYQTLRNSLANLIGTTEHTLSSQSNQTTSSSSDTRQAAEVKADPTQGSQSMAGASRTARRFNISSIGTTFTAALVSPFSSPKKVPEKESSSHGSDKNNEAERKSKSKTSQSCQQQVSVGSRSSSSGGQTSLQVARTAAANAVRPASNCSCLRSSDSSKSLESDTNRD